MKRCKICLTRVFTFDSAHFLENYDGKCKNLHGHTYKLEITVKGYPDKNGLVLDFGELDKIVKDEVISKLDHAYLNDILQFNPTCENVGMWIWEKLEPLLERNGVLLDKIRLWETPTSYITILSEDILHGRK